MNQKQNKRTIINIAELRTIGLSDASDSELSFSHLDISSKKSLSFTPEMNRNKMMLQPMHSYSNYLCPPMPNYQNLRQRSDSSIINTTTNNSNNNITNDDCNNDRLSKSDTSIGVNNFTNDNDRKNYEKYFRDIILDINNINSRLEKALSNNNINNNKNNASISSKLNLKKKSLKRIGGGFGTNASSSSPSTSPSQIRQNEASSPSSSLSQNKYKLNNHLSVPITLTISPAITQSTHRHSDLPSVTRSRSFQEPSTTHLLGLNYLPYHQKILSHPMRPYERNPRFYFHRDFDDSDTEVESLNSQYRRPSIDSELEIAASKSDNDADYYDEDEEELMNRNRMLGRSQSSDVQGGHALGRFMKKMGKISLGWRKPRCKVHRRGEL